MTSKEERPDDVTIEVEHSERGWLVVHVIDGERKVIEPPHPDEESAKAVAAVHAGSVDRWTGAAEVVSPADR
ncbi:MAG: hypothetical protein U1C73_17840, partial [Dietzia sp.]|nr:hypothetical protein [Dietzia sp.]